MNPPLTREPLATAWREKLTTLDATQQEPAVRDRDHKLLAWLEYAEMLAEGESTIALPPADSPGSNSGAAHDVAELTLKSNPLCPLSVGIWRAKRPRATSTSARPKRSWTFGDGSVAAGKLGPVHGALALICEFPRLLATRWLQANGRILNLHFNFAILFTTSPLFFAREGIWEVLLREAEGRALLERARDAALAVAAAICAVSRASLRWTCPLTPYATSRSGLLPWPVHWLLAAWALNLGVL